MISFTEQQTQYGDYTQNTTPANLARGGKLANIEHRYLLQKYFSNEGTYSITTVGSQDLTLTGVLAIGAISATLDTAWGYYTTTVQVTFSSGEIRTCKVLKGATSLTWDAPLTAVTTTAITVGGLQFYPLPPNYSKLKTLTISIGQLKYVPVEILSRQEWDNLNVLPYSGDIPRNFFIFPGGDHGAQIGIYPIPSTTGNLITFNYKFRVPDLSMADYTTPGTLAITNGAVAVSGTGSTFIPTTNIANESRWIQFAQPKGDNLWYQIASVDSTIALTLYQPYMGITVTGATGTFTIGQMPILMEDFHDMLLYKPLYTYFSSINPQPQKAQNFKELYDERLKMLEEYAGSNTFNVNLSSRASYLNPNLFQSDMGATP